MTKWIDCGDYSVKPLCKINGVTLCAVKSGNNLYITYPKKGCDITVMPNGVPDSAKMVCIYSMPIGEKHQNDDCDKPKMLGIMDYYDIEDDNLCFNYRSINNGEEWIGEVTGRVFNSIEKEGYTCYDVDVWIEKQTHNFMYFIFFYMKKLYFGDDKVIEKEESDYYVTVDEVSKLLYDDVKECVSNMIYNYAERVKCLYGVKRTIVK